MIPYLGEIRLFSFHQVPEGWAECDGAALQITKNQALFSLIGYNFGGETNKTFNLPDLRGVAPIGIGVNANFPAYSYTLGQKGGVENVTLAANQLPAHNHIINAAAINGDAGITANDALGQPFDIQQGLVQVNMYTSQTSPTVAMSQKMLSTVGSGAAHNNMQPFLVLKYYIAIQGTYPMRP